MMVSLPGGVRDTLERTYSLGSGRVGEVHGAIALDKEEKGNEQGVVYKGIGDMINRSSYLPPAALSAANTPPNPFAFMESCAAKALMGGVMGAGMGWMMGLFLGSFNSIAPPVSLPGVPDPPAIPLRWQIRETWVVTARKCRVWSRNFAGMTLVFSGVECVIEKYRAKHDMVNGVSSGCVTGAILAAGQGPAAMCVGCVGFAMFSAAIESLMGH